MSSFSALLHAEHGSHSGLSEFLHEKLGSFGAFLDEVILHSLIDTLKLAAFLFLTYLLMEFIEHKASDKARLFMQSSGVLGPLVGGAFGAIPQCGFSAAAANLYTGRVITLGTLIAVFLSTSDEMLPVLLTGNIQPKKILFIIIYKTGVGILLGFLVDIVLRLMKRPREDINIDEMCNGDNCRCERGIFVSAIHHTLSTGFFILLTTALINAAVFFIGEDNLASIMVDIPVLSHLICSLIGLIPNCAASVVLARFALEGFISYGAMLSGLLTGAGVGVLVLFKVNKRVRENLMIIGLLLIFGVVFGVIGDFIPLLN